MSNDDQFDEGSIRKFILAAFLGFVIVFCFLMIMMNWHGDYKPGEKNQPAAISVTEGNGGGH